MDYAHVALFNWLALFIVDLLEANRKLWWGRERATKIYKGLPSQFNSVYSTDYTNYLGRVILSDQEIFIAFIDRQGPPTINCQMISICNKGFFFEKWAFEPVNRVGKNEKKFVLTKKMSI